MVNMEIEKIILGLLISVIVYYVRGTIQNLEKLREEVSDNKGEISLLKQDATTNKSYFNEKFEILFRELREIKLDLKNINKV